MRFSYDGYGINDAEDKYCKRIATFTKIDGEDPRVFYDTRDKIGKIFEASPQMFEILGVLVGYVEARSDTDGAAPTEYAKEGRKLLNHLYGYDSEDK